MAITKIFGVLFLGLVGYVILVILLTKLIRWICRKQIMVDPEYRQFFRMDSEQLN